MQIDEARYFHQGIELFNAGDWFDAHEAWEEIWHMAQGQRKRFYQGLIQCAVTLEHARRGNPRGVRSIWETCRQKFIDIDGVHMGIDVEALLGGIAATIGPILDLPESRFDPAQPRGQDLPANWSSVPIIRLQVDPFADGGP